MSRSLDELTQQRKKLGNLGALDFLINIERKKFDAISEIGGALILTLPTQDEHDTTKTHEKPLYKALEDSLRLNQQLQREITKLCKEKEKIQERCSALEESVAVRFRELTILSQLLMDKEK